jgi:hypothetical protein
MWILQPQFEWIGTFYMQLSTTTMKLQVEVQVGVWTLK